MNCVIEHDADQQDDREPAGRFAEQDENHRPRTEPAETPAPDFLERDLLGGNRALSVIFAVEFDIERVVQEHPPKVKAGRAQADYHQDPHGAAATEKPARHAVRPDRRQIRDAPQNEQRPPIRRRLNSGEQQHGAWLSGR